MQFTKGLIKYQNGDAGSSRFNPKIFSKMFVNRSFVLQNDELFQVNKKVLGLDSNYINLLDNKTQADTNTKNFYVEYFNGTLRCSLVKPWFINSTFIPKDTHIVISDQKHEVIYDANNLEYYASNGKWRDQPYGYHHSELNSSNYDVTEHFQKFKEGLKYLRTRIPKDNISTFNAFAIDDVFNLSLNPVHISAFKNNYCNNEEVWCVIENGRIIGISDLGSKKELEEYFE